MGRGRMELIQKEKNRMTTFQKRKEGLMKKAYELSTLCGVDVCLIIYAPHFDGQVSQLETWPQDTKEVHRIIEKYNNTTIDRRPKIYDVQEYYKDRIKKVEAEIAKMRREKLKIMYPTWDDSFNALGEEQLRMFATMLDNKLDACNKRINVSKQDLKGKAIIEEVPFKGEMVTPYYLASNSSSNHNFLSNMYQGQLYPPPPPPPPPHIKPISDNPFYPFHLGQSSQSSMLHFDQNSLHFCDPKRGALKEDGVENNQNSSSCYNYNGNIQTMWPYDTAMQTPNSQNLQYEAAFHQTQLPGFQLNGFYDTNALQAQMINYMHGWNNRPWSM